MKAIGIDEFNEYVEMFRKSGYDVPIAISGPEQSGKSSFAMQCIIKKKGFEGKPEKFRKFLETNVIFKPADIKKIDNIQEDDEVPVDEAIRVAWKREWYRPENKWLVKLFRQFGFKRRVYYLNIPKFWSLDGEYVDDRIKIWVHIIKKDVKFVDGKPIPTMFHAVLFAPDTHAYQMDPWLRRHILKKVYEDNKRYGITPMISSEIMNILRRYIRLPTFYAYIKFPPLDYDLWKVYKKYSDEQKMSHDDVADDVNKWQLRTYLLVNNLRNKENFTFRHIAELFKYEDNNNLSLKGVKDISDKAEKFLKDYF